MDDFRDTYNGTSEPLGSLAPGGAITGEIEVGGDDDVFAITLVAGRTYTFDLRGAPGGGGTLSDSYLVLYNGVGGYLAGNSSADGSTTDARVIYTATANATYYLSASGEYSTNTGTYTLSASAGFNDDRRDRFDDTVEPLGSLAAGNFVTGNIEIDGDDDVFAITLVAGRTYTFDLKGAPGGGGSLADTYLVLYNGTGGYLAGNSSANSSTTDARVIYTATVNATYHLSASGEYSTGTGTYTLSASAGFNDDRRDRFDDTVEPLGSLSPGGAVTGDIEIDGDDDVFAITLVAGRTYTFDLKGAPGGSGTLADTYLVLYNGTGGYLAGASSSANGSSTDAQVIYTATADAIYYLGASGEYSTGTGTYRLSASAGFNDDRRDRFDDTVEPLGSLTPGGSVDGTIELDGDDDVFAISLVAGRTYAFDLIGAPGGGGTLADTYLVLYNGTGGYLAGNSSANSSTTDARVTYTATATATYYLNASGEYSVGTGTYRLTASSGLNDDYRDSYNDSTEPLGALAPGGSKTGAIEADGDDDVFAISLVAGRTYTFDLTGAPGGGGTLADTYLTLYSGTGGYLADSSANGSTTDARIVYTATASATYYLSASGQFSTGTGTYRLSASAGVTNDDYRDSIGETSAPLGAVTVGGVRSNGVIEAGGDRDLFAVSLTAGQSYTFDLAGSTASGAALADGTLRLLSSSGTQLRFNDDFNGLASSRIVFTPTSSGTYYLDARAQATTATGGYSVTARAGFDDARDSIGDTSATLAALRFGASRLGTIETGGDVDIYSVTLTAGQTYTFDLTGSSLAGAALLDGELRLRNGAGTVLRFNDDFNSDASRVIFTATTSGTYYLDVRSHTATTGGTYSILARAGYDDGRDTLTDTSVAFSSVLIGGSRLGAIETNTDVDLFRVTLVAGQTYTFDLSGSAVGWVALADGELRLLSGDGSVLLANDDFNSASARLVYTATSSGVFYLEARSHDASGRGAYSVSARVGFDDARDAILDTSAALTTLSVGGSRLGTIETAGDIDLFRVNLAAGQTYLFELAGSAAAGTALANSELRLLGTGGALVAYNNDAPGTCDSQFVYTATTSGTYYLDARGYRATTGTYELSAVVVPDDYADTPADTSEPLGSLAVGQSRTGVIEASGDTDVFAMTLEAGAPVVIDLSLAGVSGDLPHGDIFLFDSAGAAVAYGPEAEDGSGAQIVFNPGVTGTYYLQVRGEGYEVGDYEVAVVEQTSSASFAEFLI